jgi:paraquat-inducible protein B
MYLNEKAKFWIVHADVGSHGVSGLDTLISGSYIELYGVKEKKNKKHFVGLDKPYIDKDAEGEYYVLSAPMSNNISEGSNVYYRMVKVGRVERVAISPDGKKVNFTIFVEKKFTSYINDHSQFYTTSSFSLDFSQGKIDMKLASISQLVHGGISIYTPTQALDKKEEFQKRQKRIFPLFKSLAEMKAKHLMTGADDKVYTFVFNEKKNKLEIGSPVEFNSFQVGYVTDIKSYFVPETKEVKSTVFAIIHTKAFENKQEKINGEKILESLINQGLKASLSSAIPVVGSDFINLVFDKSTEGKLTFTANDVYFPTSKREGSSNILKEVEALIVKLEKLPLEGLLNSATKLLNENNKPVQNVLKDLRHAINDFDVTIKNLNSFTGKESLQSLPDELSMTIQNLNNFTGQASLQTLPDELAITMQELTKTLKKVQQLSNEYGADSKFASELSLTLKELSFTAESMGRVSLKLEKKPNALILGDD